VPHAGVMSVGKSTEKPSHGRQAGEPDPETLVTDQLGAGGLLENPQRSPRTAGKGANLTLERWSWTSLEQVQVIFPTESGHYQTAKRQQLGCPGPKCTSIRDLPPESSPSRVSVGASVQWMALFGVQPPVTGCGWLTQAETLADPLPCVCAVRSHSTSHLAKIPADENIRPGQQGSCQYLAEL
jgi:hypothetical protein